MSTRGKLAQEIAWILSKEHSKILFCNQGLKIRNLLNHKRLLLNKKN